MEMRDDGEHQHDESKKGGHGVDYQYGRQRRSGRGWKIEVGRVAVRKAGIVADLNRTTKSILAEAENSKTGTPEAAKWHSLDNWRREHCEQEEGKSCKEQHRQRCRGAQHGDR